VIPVVLLMGPTGSGKSALALSLAERFPVEIVSVDSAQVYRGMDIGTAKPTRRFARGCRITSSTSSIRLKRTRRRGFVPMRSKPLRRFARAAPFRCSSAGRCCTSRRSRTASRHCRQPIPRVRARLDARAAAEGWPALHAELARVDPATAGRLKRTDAQRIQRALEVHEIAGKPLSQLQGSREAGGAPGPTIAVALVPEDRARLHRTIAERFDAMLEAGLVAELAGLRARHALSADMPSDALRRVPAGVDVSRRRDRCRDDARGCDCRDAPAGEASVHLASRHAGRNVRADGTGPGGARRGVPVARGLAAA
jgi:tRNA dimethylallyltransferase